MENRHHSTKSFHRCMSQAGPAPGERPSAPPPHTSRWCSLPQCCPYLVVSGSMRKEGPSRIPSFKPCFLSVDYVLGPAWHCSLEAQWWTRQTQALPSLCFQFGHKNEKTALQRRLTREACVENLGKQNWENKRIIWPREVKKSGSSPSNWS